MIAGPRIDEEPENVFKVSSRINSTWGGNLVDMVRIQRYLEIIEEEQPGRARGGGRAAPADGPPGDGWPTSRTCSPTRAASA